MAGHGRHIFLHVDITNTAGGLMPVIVTGAQVLKQPDDLPVELDLNSVARIYYAMLLSQLRCLLSRWW